MNTYRVLGQNRPASAIQVDLYEVPADTETVVSTIMVCNVNSVADSFGISIAVGGEGDDPKQYIASNVPIAGNTAVDFTVGITLGAADVIRVVSGNGDCAFNAFGEEIS